MQNSVLFDSLTLGPYTLRNRIVLPRSHVLAVPSRETSPMI